MNSVDDLKEIEQKNVDLSKVSDNEIDYRHLANQIQKSRRNQKPPKVHAVSLSKDEYGAPRLVIEGEHLAIDRAFPPVAVVNQTLAEVMSSSDRELTIQLRTDHRFSGNNEVILAFDPFAVIKMNVKA